MASFKLNRDSKNLIIKRLLIHGFKEELVSVVSDLSTFADKVYRDVYSVDQIDKMYNLPEGWLPEISKILVSYEKDGGSPTVFGASFWGLNRYTSELCFLMGVKGPGPNRRSPNSQNGHVLKIYGPKDPIPEEHMALEYRSSDLADRVDKSKREALPIIEECSTVGRLLRYWPELEPFTRDLFQPAGSRNLPAVPIAGLNSVFKLPVKEEA